MLSVRLSYVLSQDGTLIIRLYPVTALQANL